MTKDDALAARCRALRLVLTDVDGVLTDGRVLVLPDGSEAKSFHIRDGLGMVLARRAGLQVGLLSGRDSPSVAARAAELHLDVVRQGVSDKRAVFEEIHRVLRPGGWLQFADIANGRPVPPEALRDIDLSTG